MEPELRNVSTSAIVECKDASVEYQASVREAESQTQIELRDTGIQPSVSVFKLEEKAKRTEADGLVSIYLKHSKYPHLVERHNVHDRYRCSIRRTTSIR